MLKTVCSGAGFTLEDGAYKPEFKHVNTDINYGIKN
jgi:hypothetical protein